MLYYELIEEAPSKKEGGHPMEKYLGISFVILCIAVLVGIIGIVGYQFRARKEKVDISPAKTNINNNSGTSSKE